MSVKSSEAGGSGEASAKATASSTRSLTSFSIFFTSSSDSTPGFSTRSRKRRIGSRSFSRSTSSLVRYTAPAGSRMEWPRKRQVRADDGVAAEEVVLLVEQVHRTALALAEPVDAPEQLGHHAAGIGALDEAVTVLAVGRDRVVVGPEDRGGAGGHRLLADGEVEEPADLAEGVGLRRLLLEAADEEHVAQKLAREVGVEPEPRRRLLSHRLGHSLPPAP